MTKLVLKLLKTLATPGSQIKGGSAIAILLLTFLAVSTCENGVQRRVACFLSIPFNPTRRKLQRFRLDLLLVFPEALAPARLGTRSTTSTGLKSTGSRDEPRPDLATARRRFGPTLNRLSCQTSRCRSSMRYPCRNRIPFRCEDAPRRGSFWFSSSRWYSTQGCWHRGTPGLL